MARLPHNPHQGEILRDEFLVPIALTQNQLAIAIQVTSNRINENDFWDVIYSQELAK
jgi:plasmid maintenance system antidote protein VapI